MTLNTGTRYLLFFLMVAPPLARGSVEGWAVGIIHMATWTAVILLLLDRSLAWNWKRIPTPLDMPLLALFGLASVSTLFSAHRHTSIWSMALLTDCILIYYLTIHTIRTRSRLRRVVHIVGFMALVLSILGFFKLIDANPFPWWEYRHSNAGLSSTYVNRNHMAGYLEMAIPLLLGLLMTGIGGTRKALILFTAAILFIAHIFTLSRGGWIGLSIGLILMALFAASTAGSRKRIACCGIAVFFCFIIIVSSTTVVQRVKTLEEGENNPSLATRVAAWKGIIDMIRDHPLTGAGPGNFALVYTGYQPPGFQVRFMMAHNDYLHFVSELGLPLAGILGWMGIVFFRTGFRKLKSPSRLVRGTTLGAMAGVTAILVHSISDFNLHVPANAILFTVLAAVAMAPPPARRTTNGVRVPERIYGMVESGRRRDVASP